MKTQHRIHALVLAALVGIGLAANGCSDQASAPSTPNPDPGEQINLEAPDGGYTSSTESPGFGDDSLLRSVTEETGVADVLEQDPQVRELFSNPASRIYALTMLWGALEAPDSTAGGDDGTAFAWEGTVTVQRGAVLLNSIISFEREDGDSVRARHSRGALGWISHTGVGFDGVRVFVVGGPGLGGQGGNDSVTVTIGSFTKSFLASELADMQVLVDLDDQGNSVSLHGFAVDPTSNSARGFLRGRWNAMAPGDSVGHFAGVWVGQRGGATGYYHGIWGTRRNGKQVFVGKVTDDQGNYRGIIRGSWEKRDAAPGPGRIELGRFAGEWVDEFGRPAGTVRGHWRAPGEKRGFMEGRWCAVCPPDQLGNG